MFKEREGPYELSYFFLSIRIIVLNLGFLDSLLITYFIIIWASTQENLSSGVCEQKLRHATSEISILASLCS